MSYSDFFFYWIIPALPGLFLLIFTILIEVYLRKKKNTPWMVGHYSRILGIVIFMIFAFLTSADLNQKFIYYLNNQWSFGVKDFLATVIVMVIMYFFQSKRRDKVKEIQAFRSAQMNLKQLTVYSFVWILYLIFYEIYFRGYLLFIAFPDTSLNLIITFNLFLYAFVHLNKGWQQVIMSFPFGFLLCLVTLFTGHIWFALIIHIQLALGFELPLLGKSQTNLSTQ